MAACKHSGTVTTTEGWPAGKVSERYIFEPVSRCDDCGNVIIETVDDKGNVTRSDA